MSKYSPAKPNNIAKYSAARSEQIQSMIPAPITSGPNQNMTPFTPPVAEKKPYQPFESLSQKSGLSLFPQLQSSKLEVPQLLKDVATNQKDLQKGNQEFFQNWQTKQKELTQPVTDTIRKPFEAVYKSTETARDIPQKVLNHPAVAPHMQELAQRTSGTGIVSMVQAVGPKTFQEAYEANRAFQAGDHGPMKRFFIQLGDTAPQTVLGVALNFVPVAGRPLSASYWAAISANEQIEKHGQVESLNPIVIDVLGDRILGNSIQSLFKTPAKSLTKVMIQNFGIEGGTEVAQDLLKYADAYNRAQTPEEKKQIMDDAKKYFTSGQILMTFGVGGTLGAGMGAAGYGLSKGSQPAPGDISVPPIRESVPPPPPPGTPPPPGQTQTEINEERQAPKMPFEEFLKAQGTPVFHGSNTDIKAVSIDATGVRDSGDYGAGFYITPRESLAKTYANLAVDNLGGKPVINKMSLSKDVKLFELTKESALELKKRGITFPSSNKENSIKIRNYILDKGFDGLKIVDGKEFVGMDIDDVVIFNVEKLKTKSQLEQIWKTQTVINEERGGVNQGSQNLGPGHKKLSKSLRGMVNSGTLLPEDVTIIETLLEGTNDSFLDSMQYNQNARLSRALGRYRKSIQGGEVIPGTEKIELQKGIAKNNAAIASRVFTHEFGHAGYYTVLNAQERAIVDDVFRRLGKTGTKSLFQSGLSNNPNYHASNAQEFFAESFAEYVFENKVPAAQMKPLLQKVAARFFEGLKRLVNRGNVAAMERMRPLYEKILAGDNNTPLADFVAQEPSSFNAELRRLLSQQQPQSKQVPVESIFPGAQQAQAESPIEESYPPEQYPEASSPIEPVPTEPPQKVDEAHVRTPNRLKVGLFERFAQSPIAIMNKLGLRENYIELKKANLAMEKELNEVLEQIETWMKSVPKDSNRKIFEYLDGEKVQLNQKEMEVATEIKKWLSTWADRLEIEPSGRITDYITHIFPKEADGGIPEGIEKLIRNTIPGEVYNPFLLERMGAEGYLKDVWLALELYGKRAVRKAHMDDPLANLKEASKNLETSQLEYVEQYVHGINMRPSKIDKSLDINIKRVMGNTFGARPTRSITLFLRRLNSRAKIAGSIVTLAKNLTQGVNTFSELGTRYTLAGYYGLFSRGAVKELQEHGVLLDSFAQDQTHSAVKRWAEKADKILYLNMSASELVNRGAAYFGAKAKYLNGKISPKDVKKALDRDVEKGYEITEEDAIEYAKFVAETTQFTFGSLDTPVGLQSDLAKTALQYQTFTVKQMERIVRQIRDKEWDKFARYLMASSFIFSYIGQLFGMGLKDVFPFVKFGAPPVLAFLADIWKEGIKGEDDYGNELDAGERTKAVAESLFTNVVPAGAQIKRGYEGVKAVNEGKVRTAGGKVKYTVENEGVEGSFNYARAALFGVYNLDESKEYYDKKEEKKNTKKASSTAGKYGPAR